MSRSEKRNIAGSARADSQAVRNAGRTSLAAKFDLARGDFHLQADFTVPLAGVTAVFGPSGCGKTTLLRCIAGLERARAGFLQVGGSIWQDDRRRIFVPVHRRAVGLVFQEPRLFPHLDVRGNLLYGLHRTPSTERRIEFEQVVAVLDLAPYLERRPRALSGGEQQRVAIGRALLGNPEILLLDEPLASLDARRKLEILPFVARLKEEFRIPIVYVSHAVGEVLQLATTVVLLSEGRIVATGSVQEIFSRLDLRAALAPTGAGCILDTRVVEHEREYGLTRVEFAGHLLEVPHREAAAGSALRVHVLPRDVTLHLAPPAGRTSALNLVPATVTEVGPCDSGRWWVEVRLDAGSPLLARITRKSLASLGLVPGQQVWAQIKAAALAEEWTE